MKNTQPHLPDSSDELKEIILLNVIEIERLSAENNLLRQALFCPKSEKMPVGDSPQLPLFDLPENPPEEEEDDSEGKDIVVPEHTRKKKGRKPLPKDLPRVDVVHDIPEEEKICGCGCKLSQI